MGDKETVTVINEGAEPIMLDDGTQVGAAYTEHARREVTLSENDRKRYVRPGWLVIVEKIVVDISSAPINTEAPEPGKGERRTK